VKILAPATNAGAHPELEELERVPRRNRNLATLTLSLVAALAVAGMSVFLRRRPSEASLIRLPMLEPVIDPVSMPMPTSIPRPRPGARLALVSGFTLLFFAGASFTAGAGDRFAALLEADGVPSDQVGAVAAGAEADAEAPANEPAAAAVPEPVAEPVSAPEPTAVPAPEAAPEPSDPALTPAPAQVPGHADDAGTAPDEAQDTVFAAAPPAGESSEVVAAPVPAQPARPTPKRRVVPTAPTRKWVTERAQRTPARPAEIEHVDAGAATVWLNRALPDPTPPSARLTRSFARSLARTSNGRRADWAAVLGVLRAQGERGSVPASPAELDRLASSLRGDTWRGALALSGRTSFADRASALADYYRAVGLESLVTGLEQSKSRLVERLLADDRITIYDGGRTDLAAGRIDVRIVVLLSYLAERHGSVTVSSLFSGHRRFARAGVVSAHVYGHAVDIASVGGASIAGNQRPGGLTEAAVRSVLLLPAELQPQQVISLLGLGGPSFPLADHGDHIHVGY